MKQAINPAKYKIICRLRDGKYTEELRTNSTPRTTPYAPEEEDAFRLLHSFSPEAHLRALCRREPNSVLVFRTDAVQMGEFEELIASGSAPVPPDKT